MSQGWQEALGDRGLLAPVQASGALAEAVAGKIRETISLGLIPDGAQLPSETEFAGQLGVSTVTLRTALLALRQEGLIETRRGRNGGSFVRSLRASSPERSLLRLRSMTPSHLRGLADEHLAISGVSAMLAARRFRDENTANLQELIVALERSTSTHEAAQADNRFHIEVAVCSQSERLVRRTVGIQGEYADLLWLPDIGSQIEGCAARHREITDAINAEDPMAARELAERHVIEDSQLLLDARMRMFV